MIIYKSECSFDINVLLVSDLFCFFVVSSGSLRLTVIVVERIIVVEIALRN